VPRLKIIGLSWLTSNGKVVFSGANLTQIDVVPYPPGIYFVRLFSVGVFEVKKIMLAGKD
jgi:hypothetical protein